MFIKNKFCNNQLFLTFDIDENSTFQKTYFFTLLLSYFLNLGRACLFVYNIKSSSFTNVKAFLSSLGSANVRPVHWALSSASWVDTPLTADWRQVCFGTRPRLSFLKRFWKNTYPTFKCVRRLSLCVQMLCRWCTSSPPGGRSGRSRRCPWKPVPPSFTRTWQESLSRPHPPSKPCWSCSRLVVRIWASLVRSCCIKGIVHRAAWLIACFKFYLSHTRLYRDCITSSEMWVRSAPWTVQIL